MRKIVVDTREKKPLIFSEPTVRQTLKTGDYSLVGLTERITVEYKSGTDFLLWLAKRDTRHDQISRLALFEFKAVVVGAQYLSKNRWCKLSSAVIAERTAYLVALNIPVIFTGGRLKAAIAVKTFLREAEKQWKLQ